MKKSEEKVLGMYSLRLLIILLSLWILKLILVSLPFIKELIIPKPYLPITTIINLVLVIIAVLLLAAYNINLSRLWAKESPNLPEAGTIISTLIYLIIMAIAYGVIKELFLALEMGNEPLLILQIVLLVISVLLITRAAIVVYKSIPKWLTMIKEFMLEQPKE
ncbi:MAG: hypothetical protein FJW63_09185 [Actinobacteria bacterium]|nr:hypothetical protein [Actinomycetota bacterium]